MFHNLRFFVSKLPSFGKMFGSKISKGWSEVKAEKNHIWMWCLPCWDLLFHIRERKRGVLTSHSSLLYPPLLLSYAGFLLLTTPTWRLKYDEADANADGIGSGRPGSRACQTAEEWVTKDDVLVGVPAFACSQKEYMYKLQLTPTTHQFLLDFWRIFRDILVSYEQPANSPL